MWSDFPKTNTWEDVFDLGITKGGTGWQLFGSRKPNHERYGLTHVYQIQFNESDDDFEVSELPINSFNIEENIEKLSARYSNHPALFMKNDFVVKYDRFKETTRNAATANTTNQMRQIIATPNIFQNMVLDLSMIASIKTREELDYALNQFLDSVTDNHLEYDLKATFEYVDILPPSYYEEGSYNKWIRVGWALKNTSPKLLIVWIHLSAKARNFQFSNIRGLCDEWNDFDFRKQGGLTKLSLIHWAKTDAKEDYERVRRKTIDFYVEQTIKSSSTKKDSDRTGCGDFDLANVLYQLYKHEYVCVSIKANIWYQYKHNRWVEVDSGTTLRKSISVQLRDLYNQKSVGFMHTITTEDGREETQAIHEPIQPNQPQDKVRNRSIRILNICQRLANTNDKKNIMTEAKELFYDGTFVNKLDTNVYLLCFKNGVIDFKEKCFRAGRPEDTVSMCTNINYKPLDYNNDKDKETVELCKDFLRKLFPEEELYKYMYDHLASTLIGTSTNQTFNMYIGAGRNGKSVLVSLMQKVLGEYQCTVPSTMITEGRAKVGGLSPEVVQLKGKRYGVIQEPSPGEKINVGVMKELTSGIDPIQARAPYMPQAITFIPQLKLVVCSNYMMEIKSNDYGTWRRIRVVPYKSLFSENPVNDDPDKPYQYLVDPKFIDKFDDWKETFAAMLVERAFETDGLVKDCPIVMAASNEYRVSQDYIAEYIRDRVVKDSNGKIKKTELNNDFSNWYLATYGRGGPSPKDVHEYMDKQFGRQKNQSWFGVKIRYDDRDDLDIPEDEEIDDGIDVNEL